MKAYLGGRPIQEDEQPVQKVMLGPPRSYSIQYILYLSPVESLRRDYRSGVGRPHENGWARGGAIILTGIK